MSRRHLVSLVVLVALTACGSRAEAPISPPAAGAPGDARPALTAAARVSAHGEAAPLSTRPTAPRAGARTSTSATMALPDASDRAPLRLGFIAIKEQSFQSVATVIETPDMKPIIRAVVDELNAGGGIGGRRVEAVVHEVDLSPTPEDARRIHEEACVRLTEDERVFLVISLDSNGVEAAGCYARHRTPYIDFTTADETLLRDLHPWLLPSPVPNLDTAAMMLVDSLARRQLFDDALAVWIYDTLPWRRSAERSLLPAITSAGGDVVATFTGLNGDGASAMLQFRAAGAERVVIWDGGITWLELANTASGQGYRPGWAVHSALMPQVWLDGIPAEQRMGATGAGWLVTTDVPADVVDTTERERWCFDIVDRRAGAQFRDRSEEHAAWALATCQLLEIVRAALERAPGAAVAPEDMWSLVASLGEQPPVVTPPQTRFSPDDFDGADRYADLAYDAACECFAYTSGWREIE